MKDIMQLIKDTATKERKTVIIAEGWDERCLKIAAKLEDEDLLDLILIGDEKKIKEEAEKLNLEIKSRIINPKTYESREELAKKLYELRKHKGITEEEADQLLDDVNYFGCMLLMDGKADAMAGSAICSTAELMRPALQIVKTKPGAAIVSEVGIMIDKSKDRFFFISDCSLNPEPTTEQLAGIAVNCADCVHGLGIDPKVALLSYSTKGSGGTSEIIESTKKAAEIAKKERPDFIIDAEYQGDAATNPGAAGRKIKDGAPIMGDANALIFPNLTASNIACHLLGQLSEVEYIFSFMMGMKKPVIIIGRSVSEDSVYRSIIMAAAQANMD